MKQSRSRIAAAAARAEKRKDGPRSKYAAKRAPYDPREITLTIDEARAAIAAHFERGQ